MLNKDSIKTLVASSLYSFHDEILKNEFATKKYVDDNMANVPLKKITSTEQTPIIISELSDGIYDFGNTSFVKMFSSDTEILKNVLGICILYSISDTKKILFVNFKSNIAIFNVEDRYALDIQNKAYTMLQFTKLVSIGGSSNTPVVLLDEITENGGKSFGLYQTTCTNLKLTANSKAVRLDSGSKILLVTSSTTKEITTYQINSFGAFSIKKIKYEYNKNTKEATLKSVDTVVFKSDFDNTIYDVKKNDTYIRAIYGNPFNVLNESIKNATYVNNDKTNDKNVTRYFNINKAIDNITDFDKCIIHLKFYRYGELKIYRAITGFNRQFNYFNALLSTDDCKILITLALDKQINENLEEIDAKDKCYCSIKYALTAEQEAIDIIDTGNIEIQIANNRILQLNNTKEFVPTEDYNPATKKYVDDVKASIVVPTKTSELTNDSNFLTEHQSLTGLATETYVDNKTSMENIIFEGGADNPLVIFDYWTHCPLSNGNACWVIDKEVIIGENIKNPYYIEVNGVVYSPKNSTYDSVNNAWIYNDTKLNSGQKLYMCATYEGQNKMVIPWDEMGNYSKLKVFTKTELATVISDGDSEATDEEVNAMLLEVLGGDYSVQS